MKVLMRYTDAVSGLFSNCGVHRVSRQLSPLPKASREVLVPRPHARAAQPLHRIAGQARTPTPVLSRRLAPAISRANGYGIHSTTCPRRPCSHAHMCTVVVTPPRARPRAATARSATVSVVGAPPGRVHCAGALAALSTAELAAQRTVGPVAAQLDGFRLAREAWPHIRDPTRRH